MLMLDKVTAYNELEIKAEKYLSENAFYFQGHFPSKPILPGVMIVEAVAQAGALIAALNREFDSKTSLLAFAGIDKAKFKNFVYPTETLCVYAKISKQRNILYKFEGRAMVRGDIVATVNFSATKIPR
ncbi:MAG: beta-hydroxyacyl-ACP dehydratase [Robiginitomaculum sp.]|nr:beta-hydroxyacyl-ACP dehydratase [Robiginitomaculum sp.]